MTRNIDLVLGIILVIYVAVINKISSNKIAFSVPIAILGIILFPVAASLYGGVIIA